jgi:biopolymer transport protein ExbD
MTWKIRHEGSPQAVEGLSLEEVLQGLADGNWEPTDEVMGPNDTTWRKLEEHPQFAEIASELQPPPPRHYGDEDAHVDMNALIDVCMVLLIFFILTTSYAALQSRLESPDVAPQDDKAVRVVDDKEAAQGIRVAVVMEKNEPVIKIEGNRVKAGEVEAELKKLVRTSKKTTLYLAVDPKVPVGVSLPIQRDAAAAGMKDIKRVVQDR